MEAAARLLLSLMVHQTGTTCRAANKNLPRLGKLDLSGNFNKSMIFVGAVDFFIYLFTHIKLMEAVDLEAVCSADVMFVFCLSVDAVLETGRGRTTNRLDNPRSRRP